MNQPLLLTDDTIIILFIDDLDFMFCSGDTILITAKVINITINFGSNGSVIIASGRIFCHVIKITIDFCFIFIRLSNLAYHR